MLDEQKGAYEAENLLEELGFETLPINPIDVANQIDCEGFRLVMEYQDFQSDLILGKAEGNSKGALIYINSNISDIGRSNFTASHEIGHVCMHIMSEKKFDFECGANQFSSSFDDPIEKEANGFASGLLMPKSLVLRETNGDLDWKTIYSISILCNTSLEATYRRLSYLSKAPSALIIHQAGRFKRFVSSENFKFYISRTHLSEAQKLLAVDTKSEDYPSDYETVDAVDWVNPHTRSMCLEVIYASTIILNDGFSYTLLAYDDDCLLEND